ncbi:hypothetical protein EGW08_022765 [Elysia chlorotica]|uniref:Transmembrane protein 70 n=1 Tax=Elysia chlorotica TaxID=188477 RepID=A0A3S0Z2Q1_ELYCH|nr:hypothetical protein EGW08_022765 [Elysia chlorotica]
MAATTQLYNLMSGLSRCSSHYRLFTRAIPGQSVASVKTQCVQHMIRSNFSKLHGCISILQLQHLSSSSSTNGSLIHSNSKSSNSLQPINSFSISRNFSTQSQNDDPGKGSLVYVGRIGSMFKTLKLFSLTTSIVGLSLQPYLFFTYQDAPLVTAVPFFAALNMFVFVNPLLIHHIGKKYVMEVYFNERTKVFTAVLMSFFARKYNFVFTADDVNVPDVPGMFSILTIKGRPLFVLESDFTDMEIYKHMMGFDKPLDLSFLKDSKKDQTEQ